MYTLKKRRKGREEKMNREGKGERKFETLSPNTFN